MPFTADYSTPLGQTRLLCADIDSVNPIFDDTAYAAFLGLNNQSPRLAAAQALDSMAINETLVQKRVTVLDLSTNGTDEAQRLHQLAEELRRQEFEGSGDFTGFFDYAEVVYDAFTARQRALNVWLRQGV